MVSLGPGGWPSKTCTWRAAVGLTHWTCCRCGEMHAARVEVCTTCEHSRCCGPLGASEEKPMMDPIFQQNRFNRKDVV